MTEGLKDTEVVRRAEPNVTKARRLFVVCEDGVVFGDGADRDLNKLCLDVCLHDLAPPDQQLWQPPGVKTYRAGHRPDPHDVSQRLSALYDYYLDFSRSLATQEEMCQPSAACSLMTWLEAAFDVLPYAWANGDWGAGKTKWGTIWAMTSYLGQVVTWGGSFAALRDLAVHLNSVMLIGRVSERGSKLRDRSEGTPTCRVWLTIDEPDKAWLVQGVRYCQLTSDGEPEFMPSTQAMKAFVCWPVQQGLTRTTKAEGVLAQLDKVDDRW